MTKLLPVYCIDVDRVQKSPIHDHCGISNGKGAKRNAERTLGRHPPSCNDTDRITGVTFIDPEPRCVLNGSRLSKVYSDNAFHEKFDNGQNRQEKPDMAEISESTKRKGKLYILR